MALDFPNTPAVGAIYSSGSAVWQWDGTKWVNAGGIVGPTGPMGPAGGRNFWHNVLYNVQQRGAGPWTSATYTADRWGVYFAASDTYSASVVALADSDRTAIGDEAAQWAMQIQFTGSTAAGSMSEFYQKAEGVRRLSGKLVTISFWGRATSGTPRIGIGYYQFFGSGGSPSTPVGGNLGVTPALSATWQRYSIAAIVPSATGKTFGTTVGTDNTEFDFFLSDQGSFANRSGGIGVQSGTVQFWGMQLELGGQATPLEKVDRQLDLANCMRFFQAWSPPPLRGAAPPSGTAATRMGMPLPVTMRAAPTLTLLSSLPVFNGSTTNTITSIGSNYSTVQTMEIDAVCGANWPATSTNCPCMVYMGAGGVMYASAEQ